MARQGRLDPSAVEQLRTVYARAREYSDEVGPDDEGFQTLTQTETRLAEAFKISQPMVRRIVLGLSYPDAPGPIDTARRARAKEVLDEAPPTAVRLTVTRPGHAPTEYVYGPGTTVLVEPIAEDPNKYNASGRPVDKTKAPQPKAESKTARKSSKPPAASPPMKPKRKPRVDDYDPAGAEEYQADSAAPSSGFAAQMLRGE